MLLWLDLKSHSSQFYHIFAWSTKGLASLSGARRGYMAVYFCACLKKSWNYGDKYAKY